MAGTRPWYSYPRIDNFGQKDPQGNYWKPDSNILTPPGYPVTALLAGRVTSAQRTSFGQMTITIKLAKPLNSLATHTFYEHMHDATVRAGQQVSAGQLIGHANYSGEGAALGFGLYSGDVYGSGAAWGVLQNDLKPGGRGLLNPVSLLNSAAGGKIPTSSGGSPTPFSAPFNGTLPGSSPGSTPAPSYVPLLDQVHETLINHPGFYGLALAIDEAEEFPGWVDLTTPQQWNIAGATINPPDVVGLARSVGASVTDNFVPFAIRASLVSIGLILVVALLIKALSGPVGGAARVLPILVG